MKPTYGLTDEQVESMILDSFDHAEEDFAKRLLIEARNEAETILSEVERRAHEPGMGAIDRRRAGSHSGRARPTSPQSKQATTCHAIREATLALDKATQRFAELMMDAAVSTAIRGKTMNAAGEELDEAVTAPHPWPPAEFK